MPATRVCKQSASCSKPRGSAHGAPSGSSSGSSGRLSRTKAPGCEKSRDELRSAPAPLDPAEPGIVERIAALFTRSASLPTLQLWASASSARMTSKSSSVAWSVRGVVLASILQSASKSQNSVLLTSIVWRPTNRSLASKRACSSSCLMSFCSSLIARISAFSSSISACKAVHACSYRKWEDPAPSAPSSSPPSCPRAICSSSARPD
mmetsp:Transcript_3170/g.9696  ORF Transcript_3170/g.9696 Transcript_3170/m.9696 type:complete len:207 (-) Transcript_3170:306-926(-)